MQEIWKDIEGYEGLYQVSNLGKIRSIRYAHINKITMINPLIYTLFVWMNLFP